MCGLLYGIRSDGKPVAKSLIKRFNQQASRGKQGFGYITIEDGKVTKVERATHEHEIMKKLKDEKASCILFHHRIPTSTDNTVETTHPFIVEHKDLKSKYYLIHNGHIQNCEELHKTHEGLGFEYGSLTEVIRETKITKKCGSKEEVDTVETRSVSFNDSESLAVDLALALEGKQDGIKAKGAIAFICIQTDKEDNVEKIYYGRNYNPLVIEENNGFRFLKSAGGGKSIEADVLYVQDWTTKTIAENDMDIGKKEYRPAGFHTQLLPAGKQEDIDPEWDFRKSSGKTSVYTQNGEYLGDKGQYRKDGAVRSPVQFRKGNGIQGSLLDFDDFDNYRNDIDESSDYANRFLDDKAFDTLAKKHYDKLDAQYQALLEERDQEQANCDYAQEEIIRIKTELERSKGHPDDNDEIAFWHTQVLEASEKIKKIDEQLVTLAGEYDIVEG